MKRCVYFLLLVLVAGVSWSQEARSPAPTQYYGLGAGFISGVGFMYRLWDGPLGLQITGLPPTGVQNPINLGLNGLWLINDTEFTRFFGYLGASGWSSPNTVYATNGNGTTTQVYSGFVGGGIGLELVLGGHIALDLQSGYLFNMNSTGGFLPGFSVETSISYRL